jgi:hypothetical protein
MTIQELAERKTLLSRKLEAISMCNVYGKSNDDLVALNLDQIETQKELFDVERQIRDYIEGKAA